MAIAVLKQKVKAKVKDVPTQKEVAPEEMTIEQLADSYGDLQDKIAALMNDPIFAKFKLVETALKAKLAEYPVDVGLNITGAHWMLEVGPCSKSPRKVEDVAAVAQMLGQTTFMKLASIGIGDAEKYLTPEQVSKVVSKEKYTANRKIVSKYLG